MKLRRTSNSHRFFALLNRPGLIFWVTGFLLTGLAAVCLILIAWSLLATPHQSTTLYLLLRESMLSAAPTWMTMMAAFVLGIQFFTLGFLTSQNKSNHEDIYRTLNTIYNQVRERPEEEG